MKVLFKFFIKFLLAGVFMNFVFPEIIYQYNKFEFSDSLLQQIKSIDINDLQSNLPKITDVNGNIVTNNINDLFLEKNNPRFEKEDNSIEPKIIRADRSYIVNESKKHIGIPYSYGDASPIDGFDCSGFTWYVYKKSINYNLPRSSKKQFSNGAGKYVNFNELRPGDLMFFTNNGQQISHVTIFLNKDKFIHAPRTGRRISIETMNRYWKQRFVKGKTYIQ